MWPDYSAIASVFDAASSRRRATVFVMEQVGVASEAVEGCVDAMKIPGAPMTRRWLPLTVL